MPSRLTFNLILASCFSLFWLGSTYFFEWKLERLGIDAVTAEAKLHMQASLAIREYTQQHVTRYFDAHPDQGFNEVAIPAFASKSTLSLLYQKYPGYQYREAVLNPLNPVDLATGWEAGLIHRYRESKSTSDEVEVLPSDDGRSLHAVKAIRISNERCLNCHGAQQEAPKAMLTKYPGPSGFGWRLNEIVGAQIVTIPKQEHVARFLAVRKAFDWALLLIFGSLFVVLNLLLERMVLAPMRRSHAALSSMADTDALTSVANRRAFDNGFKREIADAKTKGKPLALLLIDIDFFKSVNDQFGHGAGDRVLQQLAHELSLKFRSDDLFARLGGEEFIAMLPGVGLSEAVRRAELLRELCAQTDFDIGRPLTLSIGVAQWNGAETQNELIQRCDAALYRAKHEGRNRVETAN